MENIREDLEKTIFALEQERKKLSIIANMSANLIFEYDIQNNVMQYTRNNMEWDMELRVSNFTDMLKNPEEIWIDDIPVTQDLGKELQSGREEIAAVFRRRFPDGSFRWVEFKAITVYDEEGIPSFALGCMADINERKKKELLLERMSRIDALTELLNQTTVRKLISDSLDKKSTDKLSALFIIDIDYFKEINDSYGHLFGDAVLCSVADEMRQIFKNNAFLGRIGGDEFIAYMENSDRKNVEHCAQRICRHIRNIYGDAAEKEVPGISCSVGISMIQNKRESYEQLFEEADKALYYVKKQGKGSYEIYDGSGKYLSSESMKEREGLEYRTSIDRCADDMMNGMHNLILFSVELLEKSKDTRKSVLVILDRVGRYFNLDEIALLIRDEKEIPQMEIQWTKTGKKPSTDWKCVYSRERVAYFMELYDESGMAVLTGSQMEVEGDYVPLAKTILTVKTQLDEYRRGDIAFVDETAERVWSYEEKTVIKGLAAVLYSHITKINALENTRRVEHMLRFDAVTGLPNYSAFLEMSETITRERPQEQFAIAYSGFSNFQYVNDTFGYVIGDVVLTRFGQFIQEEFQAIRCCTRITGDQFILLLKYEDLELSRNEFIACCKRFSQNMETEIGILNMIIFSGMAEVQKNQPNYITTTIDHANLARKHIRGSAETNSVIFTDALKHYTDEKLKIVANMASALEKEEFKVFLQPKLDLSSGEVIGAEALVRWIKKDGSIVYPDSFIPIFEENGFICQVDFYVLQRVLMFLKSQQTKGKKIVPVSVNFSRRNQENPHFVADILALLEEYGLSRKWIEAEITESAFMKDVDTLLHNISLLRENGITVSIDDFGSGYSSLNVLGAAQVDIIKIDKVFLDQNSENADKKNTILTYLIAMMKKMGFHVLVEGVETQEQLAFLKNTDCDMIQGYCFARPMSMVEFEQYL